VNADSVDATVHATRTVDGATCDTGLVVFTARPIAS
jgi:hypothetical protein